MKYFVSRQSYWGEEEPLVVEIAQGGCDFAGSDMLADGPEFRKLGSCEEYTDPREALAAAFRIKEAWEHMLYLDGDHDPVRIETGFTAGFTMPFTSYPSDDDLRKWAQEEWDKLPKCDWCGEAITGDAWMLWEYVDSKFCSQYCADEFWADQQEEEEADDEF